MNADLVFTLEKAAWPALVLDRTGLICRANPAATRLFSPVFDNPGAPLSAIWSPDNNTSAEQFIAQAERAGGPATHLKFKHPTGSVLGCLACICVFEPVGGAKEFLLQLLPDTAAGPDSKGRAAEPALLHKQKLECALQLARTVALDFNNALTSILGHTSLVLSKMEPNHPWRNSLLEVEKSAAKAAEIANDLGTFSRQEKESSGQTAGNLNSLLQRAVEFSQQNAAAPSVEWKLILERRLFAARFDEAKMQQAFIKLLENAVQALPGQGRITVQSRNVELAERSQDRNVQLPAGAYVCVEITDNGSGIPPEVLPRVFEPFFTTKTAPHRGLGLAWVYGIVTNHGGGVAVSSQAGAGTSVRVYLPAETGIVNDHDLNAGDLSGNQTVLLVDDEDLLLTMGQTILSAYGYQVLTANSGEKALELLAARRAPVDLVITDLVMPGMSGRELMEQVRQRWPELRLLCTSGYVWPAGQKKEANYLQKPFTSQELLLKVKQVLA